MLFHPLIQTSSLYFSRLKRVCHTQTLTSTERHISSLHIHLWVQLSAGSAFPQPDKNDKFLRFLIIKECGSTLYVSWHMRFRPLIQNSSRYFSRLKRVCRTQTLTSTEHHISSLHSRFWGQLSARSPFVQPDKKRKFLRFFIIIIFKFKIFFSNICSNEIPQRSACR